MISLEVNISTGGVYLPLRGPLLPKMVNSGIGLSPMVLTPTDTAFDDGLAEK